MQRVQGRGGDHIQFYKCTGEKYARSKSQQLRALQLSEKQSQVSSSPLNLGALSSSIYVFIKAPDGLPDSSVKVTTTCLECQRWRQRQKGSLHRGENTKHPRQMVMCFQFSGSPGTDLAHIPALPVSLCNPLFLLMSIFMADWTFSLATILKYFLLFGLLWE